MTSSQLADISMCPGPWCGVFWLPQRPVHQLNHQTSLSLETRLGSSSFLNRSLPEHYDDSNFMVAINACHWQYPKQISALLCCWILFFLMQGPSIKLEYECIHLHQWATWIYQISGNACNWILNDNVGSILHTKTPNKPWGIKK